MCEGDNNDPLRTSLMKLLPSSRVQWGAWSAALCLAAACLLVVTCNAAAEAWSDRFFYLAIALAAVSCALLCWARRFREALAGLVLFAGTFIFAGYWLLLVSRRFPLNVFDGTYYVLAHIYAARGLVPYRDFAFIYPPGTMWIFGQLLRASTPTLLYAYVGTATLAICLINTRLLVRLLESRRDRWAVVGLYLAVSGTVIGMGAELGAEWLTVHLIATELLAILTLRRHGGARWAWLIAIVAMATMLIRWDRAVTMFGILAGAAAGAWALASLRHDGRKTTLLTLRHAALAHLAGLSGAALVLIAWLYHEDVLVRGLDIIFAIPTTVIGPYRRLPMPMPRSILQPEAMFLTSLAVCLLAAGVTLWSRRRGSSTHAHGVALLLCLTPLSMIPYALGRSDFHHYVPLFCMTAVALVLLATTSAPSWIPYVGLAIVVLPAWPLLDQRPPTFGLDRCYAFEASQEERVGDCRAFLDGTPHRSLFVGRVDYHRYIVSKPGLYLADLPTVPATAFIIDDPGVQNSCEYGDVIVAELQRAQRPLLALLATDGQPPEPNETARMTSCGRIEAFLAQTPFERRGSCKASGTPFEVRLYSPLASGQ